MGNVPSRTEDEIHQEEITEGSVPSTPILTPKIKDLCELDPRSPSNNVIRTPIETILMKQTNLKDAALNLVECTPRLKYLNIDPRSPTTDFNRTPIVIIQNKSDSRFEHSPKVNAVETSSKRKSHVLLETNLDYVETDIDVAYLKNTPQRENQSLVDDTIEADDECDSKREEEVIKNLEKEIETINLSSDIFEKDKPIVEVIKSVPEILLVEAVEELSVKKIPISETSTEAESFPKDLTVVINNVKDFDKKLTNLIYEDTDSPLIKRDDVIQTRDRTPLATRSGNIDTRKKVPKLKVLDRPKKYHRQFSKIPISNQSKRNKITVQCENTPPRSLKEKKGKIKKSVWDADKTLII